MTGADQTTGKIWLRDVANTSWTEIGVIGLPFAWTAVAGSSGGGFSTGDVKATLRECRRLGWVLLNDGRSARPARARPRANADCEDLFALLWTNISNTWAALQDASGTPVGRGANAAADWAANRRLVLPKTLGRALASAGWGSGLSDRALGQAVGAETHLLTTDEMPAHNHAGRAPTAAGCTRIAAVGARAVTPTVPCAPEGAVSQRQHRLRAGAHPHPERHQPGRRSGAREHAADRLSQLHGQALRGK